MGSVNTVQIRYGTHGSQLLFVALVAPSVPYRFGIDKVLTSYQYGTGAQYGQAENLANEIFEKWRRRER